MEILIFGALVLAALVVAVFVWAVRGDVDDDWEPPKRRERDLFTLVVGIALGAALFGDDD